MRRRDFAGVALGAALIPSIGAAQTPRRIAWVTAQRASSLAPYLEAFHAALRDLGYEQGRNLEVEYRFGDDDAGQVPQLASELVNSGVALLLVQGQR